MHDGHWGGVGGKGRAGRTNSWGTFEAGGKLGCASTGKRELLSVLGRDRHEMDI